VEDKEIFDTEPESFIENVFNNAGGTSRKNITHDLAKAITKYFKNEAVPVLQKIVYTFPLSFFELLVKTMLKSSRAETITS